MFKNLKKIPLFLILMILFVSIVNLTNASKKQALLVYYSNTGTVKKLLKK